MLRYIKVNGDWVDTLREQVENHKTYIIIDEYVYVIYDDGTEDCVGRFEGETDE